VGGIERSEMAIGSEKISRYRCALSLPQMNLFVTHRKTAICFQQKITTLNILEKRFI
jgi:hypothetical protein